MLRRLFVALALSASLTGTAVAVAPPASAMAINCLPGINNGQKGHWCDVIYDDGSREQFWVPREGPVGPEVPYEGEIATCIPVTNC